MWNPALDLRGTLGIGESTWVSGHEIFQVDFFFLIEFRGKFFSTFLHTHLQPLPTNTTENKKVFGREESLSSIPLLLLEIRQSVHVPGSENARILNSHRHIDDGQHNLSS